MSYDANVNVNIFTFPKSAADIKSKITPAKLLLQGRSALLTPSMCEKVNERKIAKLDAR